MRLIIQIIWLLLTVVLITMGAFGYIGVLLGAQWTQVQVFVIIGLYVFLFLLQIGIKMLADGRTKKQQTVSEHLEIFRPGSSEDSMRFFKDNSGNRCVSFKLKHVPRPDAIQVWEGGYSIAPNSVSVVGQEVIFRGTLFQSYEDYCQMNGAWYQVKYQVAK